MRLPLSLRPLVVGIAVLSAPALAAASNLMEWNEVAFKAAGTARQSPPMSTRTMAMVHAAMFDAVNAIQPRYEPFKFTAGAPSTASVDAASAAAAHAVLSKQFPEQKAALDEALAASLAKTDEGTDRGSGIAVGAAAAASLLAWCAEDRVGLPTEYRFVTAPGVYVGTTLPAGHDFAVSRPWLMTKADQFRPGPPPALSSDVWARDVNETRQIGAKASKLRSPEQTEVATFWIVTGAPSYNAIIRQAVSNKNLDPVDAARVMALAYMAATDSLVAVFDAKYTYNFWRPITAVRNGDQHGNSAVQRDAGWLPLVDAPLHPEYPCAHCISSAAVAKVLQTELGDESSISMTSPFLPGVTRRWSRFSDYSQEVSNARIWSGVHYRNSAEVGARMGGEIGSYATANFLKHLK
ncbi:phosphatase PAP2 family protein [Ramlibacter henchirensis]|uniref:Phosphatase PAP2 family protein n=1 Tax=Ramlibacter henchirensis TaxID=204072 RepID=A0A4Z0C377_9BURK|nr:vanadium-dependent haloperoxidase [Ramlibacter henchirensis]TFZ05661.1 phosphatase PAP2 family protein [Ramlibacter henchirensis]